MTGQAYGNLSKKKKKKKKRRTLREIIFGIKKLKEYKPTKIPQRYKGKNRELMRELMED